MVKTKSSPAKAKSTKTTKVTKTTKNSVRPEKHSALFMGVLWFIAIFSLIVFASWAVSSVINANNSARLDRIEAIYNDLRIDSDEYQLTNANLFGDKRAYVADKSRSFSSEVNYVNGDTVTNTFNALDAKIREAGFEFVNEPYPGSTQKQYHYKSEKGEYIRLSVSSKLYDDAIRNAAILKQDFTAVVDEAAKNVDAAPANVTIKVNLDDNNE